MWGFRERLTGALYGLGIGDAMGAPVEGWPAGRILKQFGDHDFTTFLPTTHGGDPAEGKGNGRITDDTLMTEALIRAYGRKQDHMDAYDFRDCFVPEFVKPDVWVPERRAAMPLIEQLNDVERYTRMRLGPFQAYPRHAGTGNCINCGVAMYILPVGAVNAAQPSAAFAEAVALAMAETDSYAVEAAGVLAAAYAETLSADATISRICHVALRMARDGTHNAIQAVLAATDPNDELEDFIDKVRAAFLPFDPLGSRAHAGGPDTTGSRNEPSRVFSIEEVPVALAALKWGDADFLRTVRAAVCYGRDCDSIAGMACGLYGAIIGAGGMPAALRSALEDANRRDFEEMAESFEETIVNIFRKDEKRFRARQAAMSE